MSDQTEFIERLLARIEQLEVENKQLRAKVDELLELLEKKAKSKSSKKPKLNYSLDRNQELLDGQKPERPSSGGGRKSSEDKSQRATDHQQVFPSNTLEQECVLKGHQFVWRLNNGQAVYTQYDLFALPQASILPTPPGVHDRRSEHGIEILVSLAYLHYWMGLSIDRCREVLHFFTGLQLSKSQADSLLSQLSRQWNNQYEAIAELLALQTIVYVDETGWKINGQGCYTWIFTCSNFVYFLCGKSRSQEEAQAVLGENFPGVGVTDNYSAYKNLFDQHQLCWAHLIRKAIKLVLQNPKEKRYKTFFEGLYEIYRQAVEYQKDESLSVCRPQKVRQLQQLIENLCVQAKQSINAATTKHQADFIRLQRELVKNLECLFVFVENPEVEPTNNRSERNARREAENRKAGRTNRSKKGAHRRSVIMSVFASLKCQMEPFTLSALVELAAGWLESGKTWFEEILENSRAAPSA